MSAQSPAETALQAHLRARRAARGTRDLRPLTLLPCLPPSALWQRPEGGTREITLWCSDDYLGLSRHPELARAVSAAIDSHGTAAARFGDGAAVHPAQIALQTQLADWHGKAAAQVYASGAAAALAALSVLGRILPQCIVLADAGCDLALVEGIKRSGATLHIFRHNDPAHLDDLLFRLPRKAMPLIVFESLYPADGSVAPIRDICDLAQKYGAFTYLSETHSAGLYGPEGAGLAARDGQAARIDMIQGTLAQALGLSGGYLAGSVAALAVIRDEATPLEGQPLLPAYLAGAAQQGLALLRQADSLRAALFQRVRETRQELEDLALPLADSDTQILTLRVNDPEHVRLAADLLLNIYGISVATVVHPTVPLGQERLRIVPTPQHGAAHIQALGQALEEIGLEMSWRPGQRRGVS